MGAAMTNGAVPRVYLDANVFIAAFEHAGASSDHAWWLIRAIEDGEIFAATSELTLAEILVKPLERGQADLADGYGKMLVSGSHFEDRASAAGYLDRGGEHSRAPQRHPTPGRAPRRGREGAGVQLLHLQ
jgi:hypothetical protein